MATPADFLSRLLSPPQHGGIGDCLLPFVSTRDACALRAVSPIIRSSVAAHAFDDLETPIDGDIKLWKSCFPRARAANVSCRCDIDDERLTLPVGLNRIDLSDCNNFTGAGLALLAGVHTLRLVRYKQVLDSWLPSLQGVRVLDLTSHRHQGPRIDVIAWRI